MITHLRNSNNHRIYILLRLLGRFHGCRCHDANSKENVYEINAYCQIKDNLKRNVRILSNLIDNFIIHFLLKHKDTELTHYYTYPISIIIFNWLKAVTQNLSNTPVDSNLVVRET